MTNIPSGTELARPFVPAKDLDLSKCFYVRLGFEKVLGGDVVVFSIGASGFILTRFDPAESFMMQLMVDDLDAWWARIEALDLKNEFGVPEPRLPAMQPPHGHELVIEVTPTFPVVVDRDPHRLARVFSNLLSNSAKYTMKSY